MDPAPNPSPAPTAKDFMVQLENFLEQYLVTKAPFQLPVGVIDFIVTIGPWILVALLVLSLPFLLLALGLGTVLLPFMILGGYHSVLQTIAQVVAFILEVTALPGLLKHTRQGWKLLFYSELVILVGQLLSGEIVSFIVFGLISLYIIFQIKRRYQ